MRRLPTLLLLLLAVLGVPITSAGPAVAKGATSVTVSGPGVEDQTLGLTRTTDDADVGSLAETSGLYGIFGEPQFSGRPDLTAGELGPRYTLTWYEADARMVVSHVYPFAEGGAWAEVPDGQRLWGAPIETGWWHGGTALQQHLVSLGATSRGAGAADAAAGAAALTDPPPASPGFPMATTGAAVLAGLALVAGSGWWVRRRRTPSPA